MLRDFEHEISASVAERPALNTNSDSAIVSEVIDCANCQGVTFLGLLGTLSDTDCTWSVTIQESDAANMAGSAQCTVVGQTLTRALPTGNYADDDEVIQIGYIGAKRYITFTITPSGNNSGNFPFALVAVKHGLRVLAA